MFSSRERTLKIEINDKYCALSAGQFTEIFWAYDFQITDVRFLRVFEVTHGQASLFLVPNDDKHG